MVSLIKRFGTSSISLLNVLLLFRYNALTNEELDSDLIVGANKDEATTAVLSFEPKKEDDGTKFRCTVWNRAMDEGERHQAETSISVNYFPRVSVGPQNPLKVEKGETATLECQVDARPSVDSVKWERNGRFIDTNRRHVIPRVTLENAGSYLCKADNGLGEVGKSELILDVLHSPIVKLPESREAREGEDVRVECQVEANPDPVSVKWYKDGDEEFVQEGKELRLNKVDARSGGRYICSATNYVHASGRSRQARTGNATVEVNVRHRPGKAFIYPEQPVAVEGKSVTLTCGAKPPGYPRPTYRWWKDGDATSQHPMASGSEFTIETVRLASSGKYFCQAFNDLGEGGVGGTYVDVYKAPKLVNEFQATVDKRDGDTGFQVTCSANGKPKPKVRWFKDGTEILDAQSDAMYQVDTSETEQSAQFTVLSTLRYAGQERINGNQLMPTDRGHYTCQFENEVGTTETTMFLKVRHSPVVVHQHNKVAFDIGQTALITCQFQAFPKPSFEWSFQNSFLQVDKINYDSNMTYLDDDIYEGVLKIAKVTKSSYGEYTCKGSNNMGAKRTKIRLQPKGKPEKPENIRTVYTSFDLVTVAWDEGFNGGYDNTMFTIQYKKDGESNPRYRDCRYSNPCNITGLEQHSSYRIRVKASNIKGESKFSAEAPFTTKVDVAKIPKPDNVHFARETKTAFFNVIGTALPLVAKVELENTDGTWSHYDELKLAGSNLGSLGIEEGLVNNLRVRLCLEGDDVICGPYSDDALVVDQSPVTAGTGGPAVWLVAILIIVLVVVLLIVIYVVSKCCCKNRKGNKSNKKTNNRPDIVHPNMNMNYGLENKGVDTSNVSKDPLDDLDGVKANNVYSQQQQHHHNEHQSNSNSNSANGGSVNSQDSLWNVKNNGMIMDPASGAPGMIPYQPQDYGNYDIQQQQMLYQQQMMQQQQQQQQQQDDYAHYPYPAESLHERNQQYLMGDYQQQQQYLTQEQME